jgi:hypothetical protein
MYSAYVPGVLPQTAQVVERECYASSTGDAAWLAKLPWTRSAMTMLLSFYDAMAENTAQH